MSSKHRSELQKHKTGTGLGDTLGVTEEFQALLRNVCPSELIPSQEELNLLMAAKEEAGVWCQLLQTAQGSTSNEERRREAIAERERLKLELESVCSTTEAIEQELVHVEERMLALERERQRTARQASDASCKASLLSAFLLATEEKCGILEEYASHLGSVLEVPRNSEKTYFQRRDVSAPGGIVLETACTRSLRSACQCVLALQGATNKETRCKHAQETKNQLNAACAQYSAEEVMASMVECALKEEEALKRITAAVDLQRDAAELNCLWTESHNWVDNATGKGNSPSEIVQSRIKDIQLAHISSALACQSALHQATPLKAEIDQLQQELDSLVCVQCKEDPEALSVARSVVQLEMEEVGQKAACAHLQATLERLGAREAELKSAFVELQKKHSQIKAFSKQVESKQRCIQDLVQHRAALEGRLQQLQQQSQSYRRMRICTQEVVLSSLTHRLEGSVMKEAQAFCGADLLALQTTPTPYRLILSEMALHQTGEQCLLQQAVLQSRGVVVCAAAEEILPHIASLAEEDGTLQKKLSDSPEISSDAVISPIDMASRLQVNKREDTKLMVALLSEARGADRLDGQCDLLEQSIQNWWSCPAQGLLPWVTREGMSFQEWARQWGALAAKSRRLQEEDAGPKLASPLPPPLAV